MWSATTLQLRLLKDEDQPHSFAIPIDACKEQQWSLYYLFCCALIIDHQHIIKRLLDDNLDLRRNFIPGDPLRLAISRARSSNGMSTLLHHSRDGPFSGDNLVHLLLEAGCRVHAQHIILAAENCSGRTLSLVLARACPTPTEVLLKAVNFAIVNKRYQNADLLLHSLTLSRSTNSKAISFGQILESAVTIGSAGLIKYIVQKSVLREINTSNTLLRAILDNKMCAVEAIINNYPININGESQEYLAKRKSLMGEYELGYDLVTFPDQPQGRYLSHIDTKFEAVDLVDTLICKPIYELLGTTPASLRWLELLSHFEFSYKFHQVSILFIVKVWFRFSLLATNWFSGLSFDRMKMECYMEPDTPGKFPFSS